MRITFKYYCSVLILALFLLSSCGEKKDEGQLSTDLVTSPQSATKPSDKMPIISFEKTEHDFGTLLQGEVVTYSFHFTNTGDQPLLVTSVNSSCGCTVGDYPHTPIEPGKSGAIKVTYNSSGHHGFQSRTLTVMSNAIPSKTVLRIKGNVQTPDQY